jgi:hypothetical protein
MCMHCHGEVFTLPLPSNSHLLSLHYFGFSPHIRVCICCCDVNSFATVTDFIIISCHCVVSHLTELESTTVCMWGTIEFFAGVLLLKNLGTTAIYDIFCNLPFIYIALVLVFWTILNSWRWHLLNLSNTLGWLKKIHKNYRIWLKNRDFGVLVNCYNMRRVMIAQWGIFNLYCSPNIVRVLTQWWKAGHACSIILYCSILLHTTYYSSHWFNRLNI